MPSSKFTRIADELQSAIRPLMAEHGFKKRGRTFHRLTADALTQVVHLQLGSFDPPGTKYIPGLRENLYGACTVNLGVFVPEVGRLQDAIPKAIQEYDCCLRVRLGQLGPHKRDIWWELRDALSLRSEISPLLVRAGLPWLDSLTTRDAILSQMQGHVEILWGGSTPPRILSAIILAERGRRAEARALLTAQATEHSRNPGHPKYVRQLAERLGLGTLDA